tara:strand:+ start:215 stop:352 length:138 start_codon:yes stop_codon:yes gene_type:complete
MSAFPENALYYDFILSKFENNGFEIESQWNLDGAKELKEKLKNLK